MNIECPHCHAALSVSLTASGAPESSARGAEGALDLDLLQLTTIYCAEQRVTGAWSTLWAPMAEAHLRKFRESDQPLTRPGVAAWKTSLLAQGKAVKTINMHLATLGTFCRWLEAKGDLESNPCQGQAVRGGHQAAQDQRLAFDPAEVRVLLDACLDAPTQGITGFVWAMAYTGARNEEIAQLRFCDVGHYGDTRIECFDLSTMDKDQRRKTSASRRVVPVHPVLKEFLGTRTAATGLVSTGGILGASEAMEDSEGSKVGDNLWGFEAKKRTKQYSYEASRWVNETLLPRLKREGKIRDDSRLTLYSLRHAVLTQLKHKGIPEIQIAELAGHTNSSMTTGRYGKRFPVEQLLAVVEQLGW